MQGCHRDIGLEYVCDHIHNDHIPTIVKSDVFSEDKLMIYDIFVSRIFFYDM